MVEDLTFDQFVAKMDAADIDLKEFVQIYENDTPYDMYDRVPKEGGGFDYVDKPEWVAKKEAFASLGGVTEVTSVGGEDQGSEFYAVYKIGSFLLKVQGYYSSYDGTDYGNYSWKEVQPVEKTVTVYE